MKQTPLLMFLAFLIFAAGPVSAAAEDAAMVVDIQGTPAFYTDGEERTREVGLMDFLTPGDRIMLDAQTVLILNYFASGIREIISGPGVVTIGKESSRETGGAKIEASKVDYIPPPTEVESGDDQHMGAFALRSPAPPLPEISLLGHDRTAVRSTPVKLGWLPVKGADKYRLTVSVRGGAKVFETDTQDLFFILENRLKPGREYIWRVIALAGEKALAGNVARFRLLDLSSLTRLIILEQNIEANTPRNSDEAKISKAMLYKKYGLNDEAGGLLSDLKDRYPGNEGIGRELKELANNYR
jgi:hypothetical protein